MGKLRHLRRPFETFATAVGLLLMLAGVMNLTDDLGPATDWLAERASAWGLLAVGAILIAVVVIPHIVSSFRGGKREASHEESAAGSNPEKAEITADEPVFYQDQQTMLDAGWGIEKVIRDPNVTRVWFALATGHHFNDLPDEQIKRCIQRMVLSKPNENLLSGIYRDDPDRLDYAIRNIRRAYDKAKGNGVDVRVSDPLSLQGLLVFKKDNAEDWARIQTPLPPNDAEQWPSSVIRRKDHEALFVRVERAFNALHDAGEPLRDQGVESIDNHTIDRLGELRADAVAAMLALTELLDPWINELRTDSDPYSYAGLLRDTIRDPMVSARGALDRIRGSTDGDALIGGISAAFKAYLHARGSIRTCANAAGHSIDEKPSYDKWHAADTNFLSEVTRVRSMPSLRALDLQMNETLSGDSAVEAFPPPPSRWS